MTHDEFNSLAALTRLSERGRRAARRVLVDGLTVAHVAREAGISWPSVGRYRDSIISAKRKVEVRESVDRMRKFYLP